MKIYLVSRIGEHDYDEYDAFVVHAEDEYKAKLVKDLDEPDNNYGSWVNKVEDLEVEYLGENTERKTQGIILGSFNAG